MTNILHFRVLDLSFATEQIIKLLIFFEKFVMEHFIAVQAELPNVFCKQYKTFTENQWESSNYYV